MKKTLLFTLFFLAAISANAQVTLRPGIRGGINFSRITETDLDTKTDFYIGGFAALKLSRFYTLQPEITYSRQGGKGNVRIYDNGIGDYTQNNIDLSLQYISLVGLNKFTFSDSFNIHVGPTFDIITNSGRYTYNDVDLGITAGLGYTLPMGLTIEARVKKGIIETVDTYYYNDNDDQYSYGNTATNLVFSLGLSYSFDVKGTTK
ncbi:outer membrane beta-barrel protein [Flavobacterium sp. NRK1]|uniref:outer membrane beta-barrel protein n=1 Tax=Flavobacterium sp. NRK1 TaxID=2954929 RepID=UPI002092C1CB|nr:outer membrane beta-barrel protein [Flavobacterium sp. NRK1]MCO6147278.1 porin family protein [Flavobacterium sp. NRK1]